VAQGVPFAREYGGLLANRSFGGAQVSRTFYARGQTGQQLLLGAYSGLSRQIAAGSVEMFPRSEMLDLVVVDGHAKGIVVRDLVSGTIRSYAADCVILATGGYGNVFYLSTNAKGCNTTAIWRAHKKGALFANPCYTQIHPTCIPVAGDYQSKLTLMSESLRNDGRVWVPKKKGDTRSPSEIPDPERDYYLERKYPSYGNLAPRDIASRAAKEACDNGLGVGPNGLGVYLDFADAIKRLGKPTVEERYGNLFDMYQQITGENAYERPMRIFPAVGASALMQGLADGYFVIPSTIGNYLAPNPGKRPTVDDPAFKQAEQEVRNRMARFLGINGRRSVDSFHRELGLLMWDLCGMGRTEKSLSRALNRLPTLREEFWKNLRVTGGNAELNQSLEKAGRVADFLELGELMCLDALERRESCGGHFREEYQTKEGEALRDDANFAHVAAWESGGETGKPIRHVEPLIYENIKLATRSYK
jgi:succinate dehydrogenase / fumarate reductase flavoprotein subunit